MSRSFAELIKDYEADPAGWEVIQTDVVPSTNVRNQGGTSVQELLRHKTTGEEMVRHSLYRSDGRPFQPAHFRPYRK
jgi:hypothetical protein